MSFKDRWVAFSEAEVQFLVQRLIWGYGVFFFALAKHFLALPGLETHNKLTMYPTTRLPPAHMSFKSCHFETLSVLLSISAKIRWKYVFWDALF